MDDLDRPLPKWAEDAVAHLPSLVSLDEAADFLGVTTRTLRRWRDADRLVMLRTAAHRPGKGGGGRVRVPRRALAAFLARGAE